MLDVLITAESDGNVYSTLTVTIEEYDPELFSFKTIDHINPNEFYKSASIAKDADRVLSISSEEYDPLKHNMYAFKNTARNNDCTNCHNKNCNDNYSLTEHVCSASCHIYELKGEINGLKNQLNRIHELSDNGFAPNNFFTDSRLREFLQEIDKISLEHKPHVTATQENIGRTKYYMPAKSTEIPDMDDE